MTTDLEFVEKLIRLFEASTLTELEIDETDARVTLARQREPAPQIQYAMPSYAPPQAAPASAPAASPSAAAGAPAASGAKLHEIKSPIVGTLYRAPAPDAESYVQVGQHVENGQTLCIIEAMKLMNEIESDASGKIVKILVENGQPVEYGQVLMILEQ